MISYEAAPGAQVFVKRFGNPHAPLAASGPFLMRGARRRGPMAPSLADYDSRPRCSLTLVNNPLRLGQRLPGDWAWLAIPRKLT